ncbi:MAG TPA: ChbG/HpnK family deacetylase, partial [Piscinibacter sp.]|nr:ChbG/HpnK family deacetylase [Piscinibacter sp.]
MSAARQLVVCADDYGLSQGIDRAIERLLAAGRLGAVSCLVNGARWAQDGPALAAQAGTASIGLHFNLSEGAPLSPTL